MSDLTELQKRIIEVAKTKLKYKPWYQGICIDKLPEDSFIERNFAEAVDIIVSDTIFWDAPCTLDEATNF